LSNHLSGYILVLLESGFLPRQWRYQPLFFGVTTIEKPVNSDGNPVGRDSDKRERIGSSGSAALQLLIAETGRTIPKKSNV
jgi:hypothetical protein